MLLRNIFKQIFMWGFWMLIPICIEIIKGIFSAIVITTKSFKKESTHLDYFPTVTLLIPVFNSKNTLEMCLKSILNQTYPVKEIEIFLIDNGSNDNSYEIFQKFQVENPKLKIWWYNSKQGKSKALNKGIFTSHGKYIINIDSDGWLDKDALMNIIQKFETNRDVMCMTGAVLIDPQLVRKTKNKRLKRIQTCEFFEYIQAFLIGRNLESTFNTMYTMAGAFSCFKREAILKTQMYNSETLGEDTHMTFQIRKFVGGKISLCENAFFYVDPIESVDKLYTQRQRWQRSEIEVAKLFKEYHLGGIKALVQNFTMRTLITDHTLAFSKFLWFFAMIYLYCIDYSAIYLIVGNVLLYLVYVLNNFVYMKIATLYLRTQTYTDKYVKHKWYYCFFAPLYSFGVFWIRIAGIINSMHVEPAWKTKTLSDEMKILKNSILNRKQ